MENWVLLRQSDTKEVNVAEKMGEDVSGVWVRFPRNPEPCHIGHPAFNRKFVRTVAKPNCC